MSGDSPADSPEIGVTGKRLAHRAGACVLHTRGDVLISAELVSLTYGDTQANDYDKLRRDISQPRDDTC